MNECYFCDGRFVRGDEPVVRLEDRGYQFGDGVYDAWMILGGRHFLRAPHLDRLERSCAAIGIGPCYSRAEVESIADQLLERCPVERGVIYLQWTRGWQSPRSHAAAPGLRPILSGFARELKPHPEEYFSRGVGVIFYPDERHFYCHIKSLNLLGTVLASDAARAASCHEAIFVREMDGKRLVTECSRSNCFAVAGGAIYTAPLGKLILPGVTRHVALEIARGLGIPIIEEYKTPEFFAGADEVFISATSGILPVGSIDGKPIGRGERPVFAAIEKGYRDLISANGAGK